MKIGSRFVLSNLGKSILEMAKKSDGSSYRETDGWAAFERAVERAVNGGGPKHKSASRFRQSKQSKQVAGLAGEDWEVWGFDDASETFERQSSTPLSPPLAFQVQGRVVAYFRQNENEAELVFPHREAKA
jgi:hypothetical protein